MLNDTLKQQLNSYLGHIVDPIELTVSADDSAKAQELYALAKEISEMSEKISLTAGATPSGRTPSLAIASPGTAARVEFAGIPMGHEFSSLVLALLQVGGHPAKEEASLLARAKNIAGPLKVESYISLSCQNCPEVVQAFNLLAVLNPEVEHVMIDGALFQQEVETRKVLAVPAVYINGELFGQGRMTLGEIVDKLDTSGAEQQAAELSEREPYDVLVVGGGPAGAAAAIYAARKGIRTGVVAERFGGQVQDTMAIENFISVKATEGPKLVAGLEQHVLDYDVDLIRNQRAASLLDPTAEQPLWQVQLESGASLQSRSVIISTGARWREMNVPGEQEYRGRGVAYCPHCDGPLFKGKSVAVIGGGNSGIEAAIDLAGIVEHVTVLEFADSLRADQVLQDKANSMANIDIVLNAQTTEVLGDGERVTGISYKDRNTDQPRQLALAGIFVQIGLVPNSEWLEGAIDLTERGEIIVDAKGQTSKAGVFGAGDVTTAPYKQIIIAMGSGASAALGAFDHLIRS